MRKTTQALVDTVVSGRADSVCVNGHLTFCAGLCKGGIRRRVSQNISITTADQTYTRVTGFPINFYVYSRPLKRPQLLKDSTGKLWLAYDPGAEIRVLWSTSARSYGLEYQKAGMSFYGAVHHYNNDDLDAVVAFMNGRSGWFPRVALGCCGAIRLPIAFASAFIGMKTSETTWQNVEIAAEGSLISDDHVNVKVTDDGDILAAVKAGTNGPSPGSPLDETNLFVRWHDTLPPTSPWTVYEAVIRDPNDPNGGSLRPIVMFDQGNQDV